ncbi:MAG TPA: recombinase family protein, partial [Armatimonadota bacterium]|nr:recombinase family protein [Armatimonadota bacterium]
MVWIAMPAQVETCVLGWAHEYPAHVSVTTLSQFDGHTVYAVTVTGPSAGGSVKPGLLCAVPHAHEPAGTAACMSVLCQLITGQTLDRPGLQSLLTAAEQGAFDILIVHELSRLSRSSVYDTFSIFDH